jgi:hypothetical protein
MRLVYQDRHALHFNFYKLVSHWREHFYCETDGRKYVQKKDGDG